MIRLIAAFFGLLTCSFAAINAVNGVTASTTSNINGVTTPSAVNGQTLAASGGPPVLTWQTNAGDATDLSTYSFASQAIGASSDRDYVIAVIFSRLTGTHGASISSVTIGGVSATVRGTSLYPNTDSMVVAFYSAVVPTGTTATVDVTFSHTMSRCAISVYTIKGNSSITPTATNANAVTSNTALPLNVATPSGNSVILAAALASATDNTMAWTGVDEDFETYVEGINIASAHRDYSSAGTQTVTETFAFNTNQVGLSATFQ